MQDLLVHEMLLTINYLQYAASNLDIAFYIMISSSTRQLPACSQTSVNSPFMPPFPVQFHTLYPALRWGHYKSYMLLCYHLNTCGTTEGMCEMDLATSCGFLAFFTHTCMCMCAHSPAPLRGRTWWKCNFSVYLICQDHSSSGGKC